MGANSSNLNQSSEIQSIDWENANTEKYDGIRINKRPDGIEEIDLDINFSDTDSESSIVDVFEKLDKVIKNDENVDDGSSPFISTELYKKIMEGGNDDTSSPFISSEVYKKIMSGGKTFDEELDDSFKTFDEEMDEVRDDEDEDDSDDKLMAELSNMSLTSSEFPRGKKNNFSETSSYAPKRKIIANTSESSVPAKGYGFSDTSSEINSNKEYFVGGQSSDTPYQIESSSINTSDINLVSVDSVNGRRFL
jgi:hypothetical protein